VKIGILTFHSGYNFGANLQSLSVQEILRNRGYDPVIINYRNPLSVEMQRKQTRDVQADMHERFIRKYLNLSPEFSCEKEVRDYCNDEFDAVFVGSDQVFRVVPKWAPKAILRRMLKGSYSTSWSHTDECLPVHWLPWTKNDRQSPGRASIAACATGTAFLFLGASLRRQANVSLSNFDFISVRDDWTRLIVGWLSRGHIKAKLCPDPVFGLNSCFTIPQEEVPNIDVSQTILISGLRDKHWLEQFAEVAHEEGYKVANLPDPDREFLFDEIDYAIKLPLSPIAWYSLLSRAAGYIGSRYHGLVSCVANGTPVVSIYLSKKPQLLKMNSRTYDLCSKAGVTNRYQAINWLSRPTPKCVFTKLWDESSQVAMNKYATQAKEHLMEVFDEAISCTVGKRDF